MTLKIKYSIAKKMAIVMVFTIISESLFPTVVLALTSGPSQPEFSSFEPVATTNMVNEFTGDFTYNLPVVEIPGANGGGYALSLSYHGGASSEEESSWVGYGWTLNPGSISRGKRGFPDDDKGTNVSFWNKTPANKTVSVGVGANAEAFSIDLPLNLNYSLRYNNYKGFGYTAGAGIQFAKGIVSLGYSVSDGEGSFSVRVNPMATLSKTLKDQAKDANQQSIQATNPDKKAKLKKKSLQKQAASNALKGLGSLNLVGSSYGILGHAEDVRNISVSSYAGVSGNYSVSLLGTPTFLQAGANVDLTGNFSYQENAHSASLPVYGYMYSASATSSTTMMDYYMEKLNPYDKQDKYLGIPFSNADMFSLSGEGIGGSFRAYHRESGTFRPNSVTSNTQILNAGAEIEVGANLGGGADAGIGSQKLSSTNWPLHSPSQADFSIPSGDEPCFFRFTNDQGGYVDYGSDAAQQAKVRYIGGDAGNKKYSPEISSINAVMNGNTRSGRSSYIAHHTNAEMELKKNGKSYKAYSLNNDVNKWVKRSAVGKLSDAVGEFAIVNEEGTRYTYGLPVYSRNELNLQYDLQGASGSAIDNNYIARKDISNNKSKVGEERAKPYAASYLLSEITSPDYVDRHMDGPSDDDYGGYTRFSYERLYGSYTKDSSNIWYRWRAPYHGLLYNRGELSTSVDDMGSVSYGEKEIYYLDTIVTKTHFAVFRLLDRNDGYGSESNNVAANSSSAKDASKTLKRLDRIDLYAKDPVNISNSKLVKSVRFAYDYTLCSGLPNATASTGKLTLKKVWFEYEGTYNAKVSPYIFEYAYPTIAYPSKYNALDSAGTGLTQNPSYSPFDIDAWGNYQSGGSTRFGNMQNWVDQTPPGTFDPAAWQLKVIKLPSGGEIHIQYEQDDYKYVQDKWAHAMISLSADTDNSDDGRYYLNVSGDLGSTADTAVLRKLINDMYVTTGNKMYFKFLYKLIKEPNNDEPTLTSCASEYINGYCTVKKVGRHATKGVYVELGSSSSGKYDIPKKVCRDFVKTQRAGNISIGGNCDPDANGVPMNGSAESVVEGLVSFLAISLIPGNSELCVKINPSLSYLRVPIPFTNAGVKGKKGGGIRVKRLLMYDKGIESGDAALFGSEYVYQLADGTSSGVAANEPSPIREENAVVEFDLKNKQSFLSKVVAGRDKEQAEKPLGESILPSASVGYERVVTKNIHTGKTNTGFVVKEFHTAREYPVKVEYTPIKAERDYLPIPGGLINYFVNNLWLSQGFVFTQNNMHGQPKSETTYRGDYADMVNASMGSQQVFTYYQPGEQIPVMNSLNSISLTNPGKEEELVFESRGVEDVCNDLAIEADIDVGLAFIPIPFFSIMPSYTYTESKMYSHTTSKIINYPVIVKNTLSYADGIYHLSENLAFNPHTGKPTVTRTTDGFDKLKLNQSSSGHKGNYTAYNFPASQQYPGMGQKAKNERMVVNAGTNQTITIQGTNPNYYLQFDGAGSCDLTGKFCPGDLAWIEKTTDTSKKGIFHVSDSLISPGKLYIHRTENFGTTNLTAGDKVKIEILRSGCTNQLSTNAGGFTTYGDTNATVVNPNLTVRNNFVALMNRHIPSGIIHDLQVPLDSITLRNADVTVISNGACVSISSVLTGDGMTFEIFGDKLRIDNAIFCKGTLLGDTAGQFWLDPETNQLAFSVTPGAGVSCALVKCPVLCPDIGPIKKVNVVTANAQTFADFWAFDTLVYPRKANSNKYENGAKGKWRTKSNFVYRDSIIGANASAQRNYKNAGVFELQTFNWKNTVLNDTNKWVKTSTVTQYSPDGNAMEEKDILNVYSAAKFGYDGTQPYLIAKNSNYQSVQFDGFEKIYDKDADGIKEFEDGWEVSSVTTYRSTDTAHSGKYSWALPGGAEIVLKNLKLTQQIKDNGLLVKAWVRDASVSPGQALRIPVVVASTNHAITTVSKVARTGEWTLYQCYLDQTVFSSHSVGDNISPRIINNYASTRLHIDDVRIQPYDAQMIGYVYDLNTQRLITTFDDQHFGLFYQYNAEGKLVRKMKETEKGIKTITETQYHTPTMAR